MNPVIECPKCRKPLSERQFNTSELTKCLACETKVKVYAFPALRAGQTPGSVGETLLTDDEAGCFYHAQKKAVVHCQHCGRFLCALCDMELNGQHLCPNCLESGQKKGKLRSLENHRTLYDSIALRLTLYPLLIFYLTVFTAPAALYYAIRYWNAPSSLVRRGKGRAIAAIILATLEIGGWGLLVLMMFFS